MFVFMTTKLSDFLLWFYTISLISMPEKPRARAFSASRQQPPTKRFSSLNAHRNTVIAHPFSLGSSVLLSCVDLRTIPQKIEDLRQEMLESIPKQNLDHLILMQVYLNLEYGDISIENARAYLNISKYYFQRKIHFLPPAKFHALHARDILEQLNIKPSDNRQQENLLAYEIYKILVQCSINAKQREKKTTNKHILSIDKSHIDHDLKIMRRYLEKLKDTKPYEKLYREYLMIQFDAIVLNLKVLNTAIYQLMEEIKPTIDFYLRCGLYLIHFNESIQDGLVYYRKAVELAEEEVRRTSSNECKHQLANAILQRSIARVRTDHLTNNLEKDFQHAIQLYKQPNDEMNKNVLKAIDELATYYTKVEKYQDALNILCESLPDKKRLCGDFSEDVIQTESRIGAIYLREGECLNAAEHLKACLDLQEFVYGSNDSRTSETRHSVELLKKDPMVSRTYFVRIQD